MLSFMPNYLGYKILMGVSPNILLLLTTLVKLNQHISIGCYDPQDGQHQQKQLG